MSQAVSDILDVRPDAGADAAVVVFAPIGRDAELTCNMLRRARVKCTSCSCVDELMTRIAHGSGPAIITSEALDAHEAQRLRELFEAQPPWSDLPLILMAGSADRPMAHPCLATWPNTTLLKRPTRVAMFVTIVRAAVQSRLRQYEMRDMLHQLEVRAHQLQSLALELTETEERERHRLAQLLHDDLQQILAAASMHVAMLPKLAVQGDVNSLVGVLSGLLHEAIDKSRNLSHELSPPTLRHHGLVAALHWLAHVKKKRYGLDVTVHADPQAEPPQMPLKVFLFRCAQELLFNVVKHAGVLQASVHLSTAGNVVSLRVSDVGRGFEPLTLQGAQQPLGFGLMSIRERVDHLGGCFDVQSQPGGGSSFTVMLPISTDPPTTQAPQPPAAAPIRPVAAPRDASPPPLTVALVDDHRILRSGLRSVLASEGGLHVIAEADTGEEAVVLAQRLRPDVMLIDVSMPGLSGIEATRRIKAENPRIRVIGLSMFNDAQTALRMRDAGAERYLCKAGPVEELIRAVKGQSTVVTPDEVKP